VTRLDLLRSYAQLPLTESLSCNTFGLVTFLRAAAINGELVL
jgi:hypothetical protein